MYLRAKVVTLCNSCVFFTASFGKEEVVYNLISSDCALICNHLNNHERIIIALIDH